MNVMTSDRSFQRWGGQIVHGSFITGAFFRAHLEEDLDVSVAVLAHEPDSYRLCPMFMQEVSVSSVNECDSQTATLHFSGFSVEMISGQRVRVRGSSFEFVVTHRTLRKPIVNGTAAPTGHLSRWFLDTEVRALDGNKELFSKYKDSMHGIVSPHGIIGQSFDGSNVAVSGKHDDYGDAPEFTTTAQAEGAIEGNYTQYIVSAPFANDFKYARFNARGPVLPRNVSLLLGAKTAARPDAQAGSVEMHGVSDD
jgi:hypothetical protein